MGTEAYVLIYHHYTCLSNFKDNYTKNLKNHFETTSSAKFTHVSAILKGTEGIFSLNAYHAFLVIYPIGNKCLFPYTFLFIAFSRFPFFLISFCFYLIFIFDFCWFYIRIFPRKEKTWKIQTQQKCNYIIIAYF